MEKLEWTALEYEDKEKSTDWFWALGIIVVTSTVAAIIFGNYFFAVVLLLSGLLLGFFAIKKPDEVSYEINNQGVKIRAHLYPYENIKSFWVQVDKAGGQGLSPLFFIKTERAFMPVISIPIEASIADDIRDIMLSKGIREEEMREHATQKIMESLGF